MDNILTKPHYALRLKLLRKPSEQDGNMRKRLTGYRILPDSISRNKLKKAICQWQIYRQLEHIPSPKALYHVFYAENALLRHQQ